jgi:nucleoside-diphosphate-sugar epimerase
VLVTGGAGSMGRLVTARLRAAGAAVRVFDLPAVDYSGLEGEEGIEVARGDLTNPGDVRAAAGGVAAIVHLAAILPPLAQSNPDLARKVNVEGTRVLLEAAEGAAPDARFVFSSSVSVYGDTSPQGPDVTVERAVRPDEIYAETKAESEQLVRESSVPWVVLRISGVAVPVFQEPPAEWPFTADERIEFVHRDDAVAALVAAVSAPGAARQVYNISGGPTWRMTGGKYVADYFELVEADIADAVYQAVPGHFDWYDSVAGQAVLRYQDTPYPDYLAQIQEDIERMLAE